MESSLNNLVMVKVEIDGSDTESGNDFDQKNQSNAILFLQCINFIDFFIAIVIETGQRQPIPFFAKRVRHNNVIAPWQPCTKLNSDGKKCMVKYSSDGKEKEIATFDIASNSIPLHVDIKKLGTRVIAKRSQTYLPHAIKDNKRIYLIDSREKEFYPGIIAREYGEADEYCVFFDDGVVQMVKRENIRRVEDNTIEQGTYSMH